MLALLLALGSSAFAQGKNPVILVPGLSGSELRNKLTGERVWFRTLKSNVDDLRLPIVADPTRSGDSLVATDVLRTVKVGIFPVTDVYGEFIKAMAARGGYREEKWDEPSPEGYHDALYVFPYDWRLDNVTNARVLVRRIEDLRKRLKRPDLKFDIVAHSMGGLISRYAAMYGDADLPSGDRSPKPTWAGAKLFDNVILMGTPNEGSALALSTILEGFTIGGIRIDLPFIQDSSKFTVFTIPSAYQLLPAPGTLRAYDDRLEPVNIDIYDPRVWDRFGWRVTRDKEFAYEFPAEERKIADTFFDAALARAKKFYEALDAEPVSNGSIAFYVVGAECRPALDGVVIYREFGETGSWRTLFRPKGFTRWDGYKITSDALKKVMYAAGDGVVTQRSLSARTLTAHGRQILAGDESKYVCEDHNRLAANTQIQDYVISVLDGRKVLKVKS